MPIKLNILAFEHAKALIRDHRVVVDDRDAWKANRPSAAQEDAFIRQHGLNEYAKWYLGIDVRDGADTKERYKFPYGDFQDLHTSGVMMVETRADESEYYDIGVAAADLHGLLDNGERH